VTYRIAPLEAVQEPRHREGDAASGAGDRRRRSQRSAGSGGGGTEARALDLRHHPRSRDDEVLLIKWKAEGDARRDASGRSNESKLRVTRRRGATVQVAQFVVDAVVPVPVGSGSQGWPDEPRPVAACRADRVRPAEATQSAIGESRSAVADGDEGEGNGEFGSERSTWVSSVQA
jgi:hypothetical protein